MESFERGNWLVQTPIWVIPGEKIGEETTQEKHIARMTCPHPQWVETKKESADIYGNGEMFTLVAEQCPVCQAYRARIFPQSIPEEPFDFSIPKTGPWYERLYDLGNFVILARRYNNNPTRPPTYMSRVETKAGNVHTSMAEFDTLLFSPSVLNVIKDMEGMLKLGPQRYVAFRILKEGRKSKAEKDWVQEFAKTLAKVVEDVGPESISAARTIFEAEINQEIAEMEEIQIQNLERTLEEAKADIAKRRSKPSK